MIDIQYTAQKTSQISDGLCELTVLCFGLLL